MGRNIRDMACSYIRHGTLGYFKTDMEIAKIVIQDIAKFLRKWGQGVWTRPPPFNLGGGANFIYSLYKVFGKRSLQKELS